MQTKNSLWGGHKLLNHNGGLTPLLGFFYDAGMYFMYVLQMNNEQLYFGFTNDIRKRLSQHHNGEVLTTKKYLPVKLIYYECYLSRKDAKTRETMIKKYGSTYAHLKKRILHSIKESQGRG